jgi:hypothetical protein
MADGTPADEESLDPAPRRPRRRPAIVSLVVAAGALVLIWAWREETLYFFQPRTPRDLGSAAAPGPLVHNTFVRIQGIPDRKRTVILEGRWGNHRAVFRLLESHSRIFIAQPRKHRMPPDVFSDTYQGRLLRMADQPYYAQLYRYFADQVAMPVDLSAADLLRLAGRAPAEVKDREGQPFRLQARDELFVGILFPGEYRVQFDRTRYPKAEESDAVVAGLGLPWGPLEDSRPFRGYVVEASADQAALLLARFRDPAERIGVLPRAAALRCRWGEVRADGDKLALTALGAPAPGPFVATADGHLVPAAPAGTIVVGLDRIRSVEAQTPMRIPADAMVLREADDPGTFAYVVAGDAVLLALLVLNVVLLVRRLRAGEGEAA